MVNRILWGGFGGVLVLIAVCGVATFAGFHHLEVSEHRYRAAALQRASDLQTVREAVLLSGTLARDYLFWADSEKAEEVRKTFDELEHQAGRALARWEEDQTGLRGEVTAYWKTLGIMLDVASRERRRGVAEYFYRELAKRRESMLSIADRAAQVQQAEHEREQKQLASFGRTFSAALSAAFMLTLLSGAAISAVAGRKLIRMEAEARHRQTELAALSAQLVKTQEEERKAVARELHDHVGQMLTALSMECGRALHAHDEMRTQRPFLEAIRSLSESLIVTVRDISLSLRPSMLDDFGLVPALEWHAREVKRRTGMEVTVNAIEEDCDHVAEPARTCIYRVAQEALRNCERHAGATRVELQLQRAGSSLRMMVSDNGRGFDVRQTRGLGLVGMQERVEALGGCYEIQSKRDAGTQVLVSLTAVDSRSLAASS
jgi:signal transduction histidine kinase